ncbi:MAG: hypothetical protein MI922_18235, partial [Bacteroidales bacterium]|nr:hypothetical protein [Bacteroidales bacterium]
MKKILVTALFVVFIFQTASSQLPEGYANWDTEKKIDWLIENMSLEEKVAHLNTSPKGKKSYRQNYDAKYQIPAFVSCDGPRGVKIRGEGVINCPSALNVGAAWDTNLALQLGEAYADQLVHLKSNQIFAPGLNIIRHPQNGRNNEYFSEDPLLTGKIAASNILGIQKNGCIATPKHFVANNFESGRFQVDVTIPERVLHETYMAGFKIAVEEGDPWSIMTSYNSVNGHFLSANKTIMDILYNDWNFRGYAVSDYSAEMETAA